MVTALWSKYKNSIAIPYKLELPIVNLNTPLIELPEIFEDTYNEHYYILELHIRQDFFQGYWTRMKCVIN